MKTQWRHWNVSSGFWDFLRGGRQWAAKKPSYRFSTMDSYGGGAYLGALRGGPASLTGSARVRPLPSTFHGEMDGHVSSRNPRFTPARAVFSALLMCRSEHVETFSLTWSLDEVWEGGRRGGWTERVTQTPSRPFIVSFAGCVVTEQKRKEALRANADGNNNYLCPPQIKTCCLSHYPVKLSREVSGEHLGDNPLFLNKT